jgi:dolichol-phosphate mannosyltransferase
MDLSIVVPVWGGAHNLPRLIPSIHAALEDLVAGREVVVVVGPKDAGLRGLVEELGARFVQVPGPGYGTILSHGLAETSGRRVITLDADFSHRPGYVRKMWHHREEADVLLGSRYVRGAYADMPFLRRRLSRLLNFIYRKALALPYRDLSSGFRMYRREVLEDIGTPRAGGLDVLPELVVRAYCRGWRIGEVPFWYRGAAPFTRARMIRLGGGFFQTLGRLLALRNSVRAADYDHRAFDSWIPLQRYWQRKRFDIVQGFAFEAGLVLDIGCGSSRIVQTLPRVVGMDMDQRKLRWLRAPGLPLVRGDMNRLPFRDGTFDAVVSSEVIEHIPRDDVRLSELVRVIRPGGMLIIGTPDYARRLWRTLEWIYSKVFPGGYVKEHINRYNHEGLRRELVDELGLEVLDVRYVGRSEMIFRARVPAANRIPAPAGPR